MSGRRALVASTSLETGTFEPKVQLLALDDLMRLVDRFGTSGGQGYVEVRLPEADFKSC